MESSYPKRMGDSYGGFLAIDEDTAFFLISDGLESESNGTEKPFLSSSRCPQDPAGM